MNAFNECSSLTSLTLPPALETIGVNGFYNCNQLEQVDFSNCKELTVIGDYAFSNCKSLKKADLAECAALTSLKSHAFANCHQMDEVVLPASVNKIEACVFMNNSNMAKIVSYAETPPILHHETFEGSDKNIPILVTSGTVDSHQAVEGWKEFTNIYEIDSMAFKNRNNKSNNINIRISNKLLSKR